MQFLFSLFFFLKDFIYLFLERQERREKEGEKYQHAVASCERPLWGTWPATQACAVTGNGTSDSGSQACARPTELHQPGLFSPFLKSKTVKLGINYSLIVWFSVLTNTSRKLLILSLTFFLLPHHGESRQGLGICSGTLFYALWFMCKHSLMQTLGWGRWKGTMVTVTNFL